MKIVHEVEHSAGERRIRRCVPVNLEEVSVLVGAHRQFECSNLEGKEMQSRDHAGKYLHETFRKSIPAFPWVEELECLPTIGPVVVFPSQHRDKLLANGGEVGNKGVVEF